MGRGYRESDSRRYFDWLYYANLDLLAAKNLLDDERCYNLRHSSKANIITVGSTDEADWTYKNVTFDDDGFATYDVYKSNEFMGSITLKVAGLHNVFNSLCCVALCDAYGIDVETVAKALIKFDGASRRLEYKGMINGAKVYDDYGHHPTEIMATVNGVKNKKYNLFLHEQPLSAESLCK